MFKRARSLQPYERLERLNVGCFRVAHHSELSLETLQVLFSPISAYTAVLKDLNRRVAENDRIRLQPFGHGSSRVPWSSWMLSAQQTYGRESNDFEQFVLACKEFTQHYLHLHQSGSWIEDHPLEWHVLTKIYQDIQSVVEQILSLYPLLEDICHQKH